jgi:hypothetical protein
VANVGGKGGKGWKGWKGGGGKRFPRRTFFLTPNMFVFVVAFFYTCAHYKRSRQKKKETRFLEQRSLAQDENGGDGWKCRNTIELNTVGCSQQLTQQPLWSSFRSTDRSHSTMTFKKCS